MNQTNLPLKILNVIVAAMLLWALLGSAMGADLVGVAVVVDGDTLDLHGTRIRLWGIDAPESDQLCRGDDSLHYRCGATAANKLDALIAQRTAQCGPRGFDRYGRTIATCFVNGIDLADWLVSQGLALDWPQFSNGRYTAQQQRAERAGVGIWAGSHVEPWRYRAFMRTYGNPARCADEPD